MVTEEEAYQRLMRGKAFLIRENQQGPACVDRGDIFFLENFFDPASREATIQFAKDLCAECPLLTACRDYALIANEQFGIWGGLMPEERQQMRRSARITKG